MGSRLVQSPVGLGAREGQRYATESWPAWLAARPLADIRGPGQSTGMPIRYRDCLAALLIVAAPGAVAAQQNIPADLPVRIDQIFARFTVATPGCGVGLAEDGRTLYIHGYGSANLEYGVPNTDSTVFESGSVANQFTASAIQLLVQDGKLRLDDDIRKYLPEV